MQNYARKRRSARIWSLRAQHELAAQMAFVAVDRPVTAERIEAVIYQRVGLLSWQPQIGKSISRACVSWYCYLCHGWFGTHDDHVIIVRFLHGAQRR